MIDKVQIDAREKRKSWIRLAQRLVILPKSTQSMKGNSDHSPSLTCWFAWAAQNRLLSFFFFFCFFLINFKWNLKHLKSISYSFCRLYVVKITHFLVYSFFYFKTSFNYIRFVMLQNHWPHVVHTAMESRACVILNVLIVGRVMW